MKRLTDVQAVAKTSDNTSDNQLGVTERCRLEDGANDHDNTANSDRLPATETVTHPKVSEGAKQTSDFLCESQSCTIAGSISRRT